MAGVVVAVVVIGGCDLSEGERAETGKCPELSCSPTTPQGLHFYGDAISQHDWLDDLFIDGPGVTAVGGRQRVTITGLDGASFAATTDATSGFEIVGTSGESVMIEGTGDGSNYLRIVDSFNGELYDRKLLYGASIHRITVEPVEWEVGLPDTAWAFKAPDQVAVALWGEQWYSGKIYPVRLVDSAMTMQVPPEIERSAWDAIRPPAAQTGSYSITVAAGDRAPTTLAVNIVDGIDDLVTLDPPTQLVTGTLQRVCFLGLANQVPVAGLTWTFQIDGKTTAPFPAANCVFISPQVAGTTEITASTEGRTLTLHFTVVDAPARRGPTDDARAPRTTSAGERAAS